MYKGKKITIIIPYYNAFKHITCVIEKLPDFIDEIIIVNDNSSDILPELTLEKITILKNQQNLGVGGATIVGFKKALERNAHIIIKMDADDQMDAAYLPQLITPIIEAKAEYCKGNRFHYIREIKKMPLIRRIGNLGLSFLTKAATGYWNNFDPTNGYFAIESSILKKINLDNLDKDYFFETSLIAELYFLNSRIKDIPMLPIYGNEKSGLNAWKELFRYPCKLSKVFVKRIILKYFIYDFNMASLYLLTGLPLFSFGSIFGLYVWIKNASKNVLTPTGTIMLIMLTVILGFQLILQAIQFDIEKSPKSS